MTGPESLYMCADEIAAACSVSKAKAYMIIRAENEKLKETISNEDKDDYIERIARDEYDYAGENERVYYASDAG